MACNFVPLEHNGTCKPTCQVRGAGGGGGGSGGRTGGAGIQRAFGNCPLTAEYLSTQVEMC